MRFDRWLEESLGRIHDFPEVEGPSVELPHDMDEVATAFDPLEVFADLEGELLELEDPEDMGRPTRLPVYEPLPDTEHEAVGRGVNRAGVHVLAFYKSKRFERRHPFPGFWGVFLLDDGLRYLSGEFARAGVGSAAESSLIAHLMLHRHERFHFHVDIWTLTEEHVRTLRSYAKYRSQLIKQIRLSSLEVEESLANRHALDSLRNVTAVRQTGSYPMLKLWAASCPGPYGNVSANRDFLRAELAAQALYLRAGWNGSPPSARRSHFLDTIGPSVALGRMLTHGDLRCPNYLVRTGATYVSILERIFPPISPPDHRGLSRFVFGYLAGQKTRSTDHLYVRIDNGEEVKLPNRHGATVRLYELRNIVGKAGMGLKEWHREYERTRAWKKHCPRQRPLPPRTGF